MYDFSKEIILFDGVCNLCNSTVQWVIKRDKKNLYRFASWQSDFGKMYMKKHGICMDTLESLVLIHSEDKYCAKSTAVIRILASFGGWYQLFKVLLLIPPFIRHPFYAFVARNRYRWFGKEENENCWIPTPELQEKFILN